ncbi:hypothetical protein DRP04_15315, partial [Archaeoglobales archaeon]
MSFEQEIEKICLECLSAFQDYIERWAIETGLLFLIVFEDKSKLYEPITYYEVCKDRVAMSISDKVFLCDVIEKFGLLLKKETIESWEELKTLKKIGESGNIYILPAAGHLIIVYGEVLDRICRKLEKMKSKERGVSAALATLIKKFFSISSYYGLLEFCFLLDVLRELVESRDEKNIRKFLKFILGPVSVAKEGEVFKFSDLIITRLRETYKRLSRVG